MISVRKLVYASLLILSALSFTPGSASAQDEGGAFTLPHQVCWQNVVIPAGTYRFSVQPRGPAELLTLTKTTGKPASFMLFANEVEMANSSETARLVIQSKFGKSYVSAMDLPQFEVTLHFAAPANSGKEVAEMHTVANSAR
jgi:hypothetical protein